MKPLLCTALLLALSAFGCATTFEGSAYFPGGAPACLSHCGSANMEMDSFVYMGEYSTACVCRLKTAGGSAQSRGGAAAATSGASVAAVVTQRQRAAGASGAVAASTTY